MLKKVRCDKCQNTWESKSDRPRCKCGSWNVKALETLQGAAPVTGSPGESEEGTIGMDIFKRYLKDAGITKRAEGITKAFSRHQADDLGALESILRKSDVTPASMALMLDLWGGYQGIKREQESTDGVGETETEKFLKNLEREEAAELKMEYQTLRLRKKIDDLKRGMTGTNHVEKRESTGMVTREVVLKDENGNIVFDKMGKPIYERVTMPVQLQQAQGGGGDSTVLSTIKMLSDAGLIGGNGGGGGESQPDSMKKTIETLSSLGLMRKPDSEIETLKKEVETLRSYSGNTNEKVEEIRTVKELGIEAIKTGRELAEKSNDKLTSLLDKVSTDLAEQSKHQRYMDRLRGGAAQGLTPEEEHARFENERVPAVDDVDLVREMEAEGASEPTSRRKAVVPGVG